MVVKNIAVLALVCVVGPVCSSRFNALKITTPSSAFSDAESALGGASGPVYKPIWEGPHSVCWESEVNETLTTQCKCAPGYDGTSPHCFPGPELVEQCFTNDPCGPHAVCEVVNGTRRCHCEEGYEGSPPDCVANPVLKECLDTRRCGHNSECIAPLAEKCMCLPGYVGDPTFCMAGPTLNSKCSFYPCGGFSNCVMRDRNHPVCSCQTGMVGAPPNCRPGPELWRICFLGRPCGLNALCQMDERRVASCSCVEGSTGSPPHCVIIS